MHAGELTMGREPKQFTALLIFMTIALFTAISGALILMAQSSRINSAGEWHEYTSPLMPVNYSHMTIDLMPIDTSNMPDFPNCSNISETGFCWVAHEATLKDGGHMVEVSLKQNGKVIGNAQAMTMEVEYAGISGTGVDSVWVTAIKVARYARMNGVGSTMVKALDAAIATVTKYDGLDEAFVLFVDQAGWGSSIMANIDKASIVWKDVDMFIYRIVSSM